MRCVFESSVTSRVSFCPGILQDINTSVLVNSLGNLKTVGDTCRTLPLLPVERALRGSSYIPSGFILPQANLILETGLLKQTLTVKHINRIRDTIKFYKLHFAIMILTVLLYLLWFFDTWLKPSISEDQVACLKEAHGLNCSKIMVEKNTWCKVVTCRWRWRKIFLPSEEKLKSSWKDVSGFVKGLLHTHDSREKRKDIHKKLQGLQVFVNENGEATCLNILPYKFSCYKQRVPT